MSGGNWERQDKKRPGAYINFKTNALSDVGLDLKGAVILPIPLNWGETGKFIEVTPDSNFKKLFGSQLKDIVPLREAFKGTGKVTVFNVSGAAGVKATGTDTTFIATAKYGGTDGNKIVVKVTKGISDSTVKTFYAGEEVDSQTVTVATSLIANDYATFTGTLPVGDATINLSGGTTVAPTNASYAPVLAGLDTQTFKVVALGTADADIKALFALKVKQLKENAGKNVAFVTNDYAVADHETTVSVLNGVTLDGGEVLSAAEALYFYAGAYANAGVDSLTYVTYPGAIDCERMTSPEIVQALTDGHIVFTFNNGRVVIEQDINTFKSFTVEKNQDFRKNKIVRTMDAISDNTQRIFLTSFIGKITNNANGRDLFKSQLIKEVYDPLVNLEAIEYKSEEIVNTQGIEKDSVVSTSGVTIQDAMEKLYMTVNCK